MARKKLDNAKITGLTVSRKEGERITICTSDGPIVVQVGNTRGHNTRIKIDAPRNVRIYRSELDVQDPETAPPIESDYD